MRSIESRACVHPLSTVLSSNSSAISSASRTSWFVWTVKTAAISPLTTGTSARWMKFSLASTPASISLAKDRASRSVVRRSSSSSSRASSRRRLCCCGVSALKFSSDGKLMIIAAPSRTSISSVTHPFRLMIAPCPLNRPPWGADITVVTPFTRVTGMCSLCGLMAPDASMCGFISPISLVSSVAATEPISLRPTDVCGSIIPGYAVRPRPSMVSVRRGMEMSSPMAAIRPS